MALFEANWECFVRLQPRWDAEKFRPMPRVRPVVRSNTVAVLEALKKPVEFLLSDGEFAATMADVLSIPVSEFLHSQDPTDDMLRAPPPAISTTKGLLTENDVSFILGMAEEFDKAMDDEDADAIDEVLKWQRDPGAAGSSDDFVLDEMNGDDVEDDEKDSLQDCAKGSGVPASDCTTEPREDAIGEDAAHHKQEA
jgi:hypothetical protein